MKIYYLNSMDSTTISPKNIEEIKNHKNVEVFTPEEFQKAFNRERISDLGYIIIES